MPIKETFTLEVSKKFVFEKEIEFELPEISSVKFGGSVFESEKALTLEFLFKDSCPLFELLTELDWISSFINGCNPPEIANLLPHLQRLAKLFFPTGIFLPNIVITSESPNVLFGTPKIQYLIYVLKDKDGHYFSEEFENVLKEKGITINEGIPKTRQLPVKSKGTKE